MMGQAPGLYVPRKLKIGDVLAAEEYQMLNACKSIQVGKMNKKLSILANQSGNTTLFYKEIP